MKLFGWKPPSGSEYEYLAWCMMDDYTRVILGNSSLDEVAKAYLDRMRREELIYHLWLDSELRRERGNR
jgi:hypothetical protein